MQHKHRLAVRGLAGALAALAAAGIASTAVVLVLGPGGVVMVRRARLRCPGGAARRRRIRTHALLAQAQDAARRAVTFSDCLVTSIAHAHPCGGGTCGDWSVSYAAGSLRGVMTEAANGCAADPFRCDHFPENTLFTCEVDPAGAGVVYLAGTLARVVSGSGAPPPPAAPAAGPARAMRDTSCVGRCICVTPLALADA